MRHQRDPTVPFEAHDTFVDPERTEPIEKVGHLRRQHQALTDGEAGDTFPPPLPFPDLRAQPPVDLGDYRGELRLAGPQQFPHAHQRHPASASVRILINSITAPAS